MKIGIDTHLLLRNINSGMGVYISQLTKELKKADRKNEYIYYAKKFNWQAKNIFIKLATQIQELWWIQVSLPQLEDNDKIDILYFPNPPASFFVRKPYILTIPDLSFLYDASYGFYIKFYLFVIYYFSAKRAKLITTFSENSRKDITKFFHISKNKIKIVTPAISHAFSIKNKSSVHFVNKKFILSIPGTFIPRKNMNDLIEAFEKLPDSLKQEYSLVLVGNTQDQYGKNFLKLIDEKNLHKMVILPGYVTEKELLGLYNKASLFVFPSLYEGFGLPPLEAMACGVPVIVYSTSSLPEVVGDAGCIVHSAFELSICMEKVLRNSKDRKALIHKGLLRAKRYSWEVSARIMMQVIESAGK